MKVATTRDKLHKIQHKSIQVVAKGIGLRNFQCNVCLRKIETLCCHSLNFYQDELDPAKHTKERSVQKEELNFKDLQESSN